MREIFSKARPAKDCAESNSPFFRKVANVIQQANQVGVRTQVVNRSGIRDGLYGRRQTLDGDSVFSLVGAGFRLELPR